MNPDIPLIDLRLLRLLDTLHSTRSVTRTDPPAWRRSRPACRFGPADRRHASRPSNPSKRNASSHTSDGHPD